jgi:hypothetical protein
LYIGVKSSRPNFPLALDKRNEKEKALNLHEKGSLLGEQHALLCKLGCLSDMSDDLIIDTFQTQISHDTTAAHSLVDTLIEVQKKRKSETLEIEIACQRSKGIVSTIELNKAYRDFEIPNNGEGISSEVLVGLIRGSLSNASKESIAIIAKARNDSALQELVDLPSIMDTPQEDPILDLYYAQNPVGLSNIGNTCYLNSLLQYIYTIKDIRETVLNMEAYIENVKEDGWKDKVIDGLTLGQKDVAESKESKQHEADLVNTAKRNLLIPPWH